MDILTSEKVYFLHIVDGISILSISNMFDVKKPKVYSMLYKYYTKLADDLIKSGNYDEALRNVVVEFDCKCGCGEKVGKLGTPYNMVKPHCIKEHQGVLCKGTRCSEESRAKMRKPKSLEHRKNISIGRMGYTPKQEAIDKWKRTMSEKGYDHLRTPKLREAQRNRMLGKKRTKLQKLNMSKYMKGRPYNNYRRGHYLSIKNNKSLFYRSSLELKAYIILEYEDDVEKFIVEPYTIPYLYEGMIRKYRPDIEIYYCDGSISLVEVKPNMELVWEINQAKFCAARAYCAKNRMTFEIMTDTYLNEVIVKRGELREHLNSYLKEQDNPEPSSSNKSIGIVDEKVQRLMDENDCIDKSNTSAPPIALVK